jgi:AcrR family transcriptional regulator
MPPSETGGVVDTTLIAPPRPARATRSRAAVLTAATELLLEGGLTTATIEAIAERSGVSKATIYKYWPNRICVAIDAFAARPRRRPSPTRPCPACSARRPTDDDQQAHSGIERLVADLVG